MFRPLAAKDFAKLARRIRHRDEYKMVRESQTGNEGQVQRKGEFEGSRNDPLNLTPNGTASETATWEEEPKRRRRCNRRMPEVENGVARVRRLLPRMLLEYRWRQLQEPLERLQIVRSGFAAQRARGIGRLE